MKGVSPLVATVLLIAFTVAIATLLSGWFTTLTRTTTDSISNRSALTSNCQGASITIDQVYVSLGSARAAVRNTGLVNLSLVSAQFFNATGNNFTTTTGLPIPLSKGSATQVEFAVNISSCPLGFSQVMITSSCGGSGTTFESSPKCI